jgi:hypothetical protein
VGVNVGEYYGEPVLDAMTRQDARCAALIGIGVLAGWLLRAEYRDYWRRA